MSAIIQETGGPLREERAVDGKLKSRLEWPNHALYCLLYQPSSEFEASKTTANYISVNTEKESFLTLRCHEIDQTRAVDMLNQQTRVFPHVTYMHLSTFVP